MRAPANRRRVVKELLMGNANLSILAFVTAQPSAKVR